MRRFPVSLNAELSIRGGQARLLDTFLYQDPQYGLIQVPRRFETDFASVKPLRTIAWMLLGLSLVVGLFWPKAGAVIGSAGYCALALYASVVGYGDAAATIHDWLYHSRQVSRREADRIFLNALRFSGIAYWRAHLMWLGVRVGGHFRYGKP